MRFGRKNTDEASAEWIALQCRSFAYPQHIKTVINMVRVGTRQVEPIQKPRDNISEFQEICGMSTHFCSTAGIAVALVKSRVPIEPFDFHVTSMMMLMARLIKVTK